MPSIFDTLKNLGSSALSNIKGFLGVGGGKASLEAFAPFGFTPTPTQQQAIRTIPQLSEPVRPGQPIQAIGETSQGINFQQIDPTTRKTISGTEQFVPTVRPLITTQPQINEPLRQITQPLQFDYAPYQIPNMSLPRDPRTGKVLPTPPGAAAVQGIGGETRSSSQQAAASGANALSSGTQRGMANQAAGGINTPSIITPEEQPKSKKQPQFTMVTLDQARQMGLQGAGQSGVFKDAQGNFYGISNVQIDNKFGYKTLPDGRTIIDVTKQDMGAQPFRSSLETDPISAENLISGKAEKPIKSDQELQNDLQNKVIDNVSKEPPTPSEPVVDNANQQAAINSSSDPFGLSKAFDAFRAQIGMPAKQAEVIDLMKQKKALEAGLQAIIKDIQDNPDLPKGLAARRIEQFTNTNAVNLKRLQGDIEIAQKQLDDMNKELDDRFGIAKFGIEKQITQQEQERDNARQQIGQYITSGAFAEFSDAQLQNIADNKIGYGLSGLKTMRDALIKGKDKYDSFITKENEAGDVSIIGINKDGNAEVIKTIKGVGTPTTSPAPSSAESKEFTRVKEIVAMLPNEWGLAADKIDREFGKGTATKYDAYLKKAYSGGALNFENI